MTGWKRSRTFVLSGLLLAASLGMAGWVLPQSAELLRLRETLSAVEKRVAQTYGVPEMTVAELAASDFGQVALFDVREEEEYAVSHIPGARRVSPTITAEKFMAEHAPAAAGKLIVLYCTVGYRSSALAAALKASVMAEGAPTIVNLRGGIFRWRVAAGRLESHAGTTSDVHIYDEHWRRVLDRELLAVTR